jgi:moderate conductance mechanosensitive channel
MTLDTSSFVELATYERIVLVLAIAIIAHLCVRGVRHLAQRLLSAESMLRWTKLRTLVGLLISALVFTLYFGAVGLVLHEFGVSLTAYLASVSVLGLAIGFGSQGVVQDVVTGLTVILSDLFQVGDLVEISGQTGLVQNITMRFTMLLSPLGAQVYIPNRTLANVIVYPRGYVRCFADITISTQDDTAQQMVDRIDDITRGFVQQYPGILRNKPEISTPASIPSGRVIVRVKFRIWPGRSQPVESAYKQEIVQTLKTLDPDYSDWMVSINNEVSEKPVLINPYRSARKA